METWEFWRSSDLADARFVIRVRPAAAHAAAGKDGGAAAVEEAAQQKQRKRQQRQQEDLPEAADQEQAVVLDSFPAHRVILCKSHYFNSQIKRWQDNAAPGAAAAAAGPLPPQPAAAAVAQVVFEVQRPEQLEAATAVVAAMYGVSDPFGRLRQAQLVDVAVLADMLQLPESVAMQPAMELLTAAMAAAPRAGLQAEALAALSGLEAWPSALLPLLRKAAAAWQRQHGVDGDLQAVLAAPDAGLVQRALVAALGDLEATWADRRLSDLLLALPLAAMQLLLAADALQVSSEDTVLFTADKYWKAQAGTALHATCKERLAPLVRCPQLSAFWRSAAAVAEDAASRLLGEYVPQLRQLLVLAAVESAALQGGAVVQEQIPSAPPSWSLGPRAIRPLAGGSVRLVWQVAVAELAAACGRSASEQGFVFIESKVFSPPLGGLAWTVLVQCEWRADKGMSLGVYCKPVNLPRGVVFKAKSVIEAASVKNEAICLFSRLGRGWSDFFGLSMAEGWDAALWAAKGLPPEGEQLELRLEVRLAGG